MEIKTTLKPGRNGTRKLTKEYGDQLICVRYRYDKQKGKRYKTIELIIDEQDWQPGTCIQADKIVKLKIGFGETQLRELIKQANGYWNINEKCWEISYQKAMELGLENRIVDEFGL